MLSMLNQIRPPAMWGIVAFTVLPGPPRGIAQLADSAVIAFAGDDG